MESQPDKVVSYKWNARTGTGYRLRYDAQLAFLGLPHRFHLEEWDNQFIVDDWDCDTLEEAASLLARFFEVDPQQETEALKHQFEQVANAA